MFTCTFCSQLHVPILFYLGYAAGFESTQTGRGSNVWTVLEETIKSMAPVNGKINLLDWLKMTNGTLAERETFEIGNVKYKPLLSISHTLTKQILLKRNNTP